MDKKPLNKRRKSTSKRGPYRVKKQPARRRVRRGANQRKSKSGKGLKFVPATQGQRQKRVKRTDVGPGRPPVEYQFKPGQSGNPAGSQKGKCHLWTWFTTYMQMTAEKRKLEQKRRDLTAVQELALNQIRQMIRRGIGGTAGHLTKEIWDRDEGKATEHVVVENPEALSEQECEEVRDAMKRRGKG